MHAPRSTTNSCFSPSLGCLTHQSKHDITVGYSHPRITLRDVTERLCLLVILVMLVLPAFSFSPLVVVVASICTINKQLIHNHMTNLSRCTGFPVVYRIKFKLATVVSFTITVTTRITRSQMHSTKYSVLLLERVLLAYAHITSPFTKRLITSGAYASKPTTSSMSGSSGSAMVNPLLFIAQTTSFALGTWACRR